MAELRDTYELQSFADDNTSLTVRLRGGLGIRHSRQVAAFSVDDWRKNVLTKAVDVPDDVLPGQEDDQRRVAYAQQLYRIAEARFPTASLAGQMARDRVWSRQPTTAFFTAFPEFEFTGERVTAFLQRHPKALDVFPDADSGRADLLRIEQLFHLTPLEDKLSVIQPLWKAGLRSAPQMAFRGRQQLMRVPGLDPKAAASIYRQAVHIASVALHVYLRYHPRLNGLSPYAVRLPQLPRNEALALDATTLPDWEALFGSTDGVECSHCESTISPAAYFVDNMAFVGRAVASDGTAGNALDELLARRPDLGTLQLTCANTETELPQIDVLVEIFEAIAASADHRTLPPEAIGPTTWDAAQLAAQPEHVNTAAYVPLRDATYPFAQLPFDVWLEESRRYLARMSMSRDGLMTALPRRQDVSALEIAAETLKMSAAESAVIRDPDTRIASLAAHWGVDPDDGTLQKQLGGVEVFLRHAALDYEALLRLLNTRFVNPDRLVVVTFAGDPPTLDNATLGRDGGSELTAAEFRAFLDRTHRFVRLQRRLGWSEYALDMALAALGARDLDEAGFLPQLAAMRTLGESLKLTPEELTGWWADADTYRFETELPSRYEAVFLNPEVLPSTHAGTGPDLRNDVFALNADRTDLAVASSTSTTLSRWLATTDGATPASYTLDRDYAPYLQSVTRLTAEDLLLLVTAVLPKDATTGNVALNLANVSLVHRVASFAGAIGVTVTDYLRLQRLSGMKPLSEAGTSARPIASLDFHRLVLEVAGGALSVEQLTYLLLDEDVAAASLAPLGEDMDGWLTTVSPTFATTDRLSAVTPEQKTAVAQSLSSALGLDAAVLEDLLFASRSTLGDELLVHLIAAAHPEVPSPPSPPRDFHGVFETLHKFGIAWKGLGLDALHLEFVLDRGPRLGWTDITAFPVAPPATADFEAWRRLAAAASLQTTVFTVDQSLFGLLQAAADGVADPATFVAADYLALISQWSGWSLGDVTYLTGSSGFNFQMPAAMRDERPFVAMKNAIDAYRRSGVSAEQAHAWAVAEPTFSDAQSIKQALTLSYEPGEWLTVLGGIQDELRLLRRDALLGYLLHTLGFEDSTAFYHHFLIDPLTDVCGRTSRMVEAHAAVQTFAQRILFGLEPFTFSSDDTVAWQWRKNYRIWEAARKIFLFPENWIEPELRDNKSVFFRELEDGLAQNDVTSDTAEHLFRDYLDKLDEVSRLEVIGMYEDTWGVNGDEEINVLHVFARTRDLPHLYYYRRREDKARWTTWERVALDIQSEHVIPIAYNGRLFLFWPTFKLTPIEPDTADLQEQIDELTATIQEYDDTIEVLDEQISDISEPIVEQTLIAQRAVIERPARQRRRRPAGQARSEGGCHCVDGG